MVLVNNIKYACGTCIKGHRSSTCKHSDRPLFEIKRKGRPVTQCEHCRELRKTKQVHVKCVCEKEGEVGCAKSGLSKALEQPAFPNGLPEALGASATLGVAADRTSAEPEHREEVKSSCKSGSQCDCCVPRAPKAKVKVPKPLRSSPALSVKPALAIKASPSPQHPEFPLFLSDSLALEQEMLVTDPSVLHSAHDPSIPHAARVRTHPNEYSPYGRAYDQHAHYHGHSSPIDRPSSSEHRERHPSSQPTNTMPSPTLPDDFATWFSEPSPFCQVSDGYNSNRLLDMSANNGSAESMSSAYDSAPDMGSHIDIDMNPRIVASEWIGHAPTEPPNSTYPPTLPRIEVPTFTSEDRVFWDSVNVAGMRSAPNLSLCMDFDGLGCACPPGACRCGAAECWTDSMSSLSDPMSSMPSLPDSMSEVAYSDGMPPMPDSMLSMPPDAMYHPHLSAMPDLMRSRSSSSSSSSGASSVQSFRDAFGTGGGHIALDAGNHNGVDAGSQNTLDAGGSRGVFDGGWFSQLAGCAEDFAAGRPIDEFW
ncbi:uncharacterized protein SCHCODRAFT_02643959 [Schizophyllum commune H4-8]|uniref:uncharacterized protein n=1 Tax=Schizophyllum commune (strain H4-8 / FGSC 9210) TaxID=578458 RepID=UPI00215F04F4|nr:uncharacterized protein SCHCODRAFT_02643959 [Schizophyllum commune H4-8]KAI5885637.1 hypothetical protein SCHCODRAFT_02643959 [Schizophyllum commune H4-8]